MRYSLGSLKGLRRVINPVHMNVSINEVLAQLETILLGKEKAVRMAFCCLLARGHLLIEDVPGVGKTTISGACNLPAIFFRRMFWVTQFSIRFRGSLFFIRGRFSPRCCWRTR